MVRCADCGLLGVRHPDTRLLEEADEDVRKTGLLNYMVGSDIPLSLPQAPICSIMAADLSKEIKEEAKIKPDSPGEIGLPGLVVNRDRNCGFFCQWHPGFSPKEHKQMIFDIEALRLELKQKQKDRTWALVSTVVGAIIGAAATLVAVIATK